MSVVIPVFNEALHIERALRSAMTQDYGGQLLEIVVADGRSTDGTPEIVRRLAAQDPRVRLIDNPMKSQASGLNLAIEATRGAVVARLDGHAEWRPWHIAECVRILGETGADNVGGTMETVGENPTARAIACASASPFGVGGARYRYADKQFVTDTVWLGCFRREALQRVGPFNPAFVPHEDYELNHRIRNTGGTIVFSPTVPTRYWVRDSWCALARQYFRYGRAKARVAATSPGVVKPYHLVPPAAIAFALLLIPGLATSWGRRLATAAVSSYGAISSAEALRVAGGQPLAVKVRVPIAFAEMHIAWGAGFWAGAVAAGATRFKKNVH